MGRTQWEAIAAAIRNQIELGELSPGDRVRSESEIAEAYGVSRPTAHRALNELQRQGFLLRQRRWGTVVAKKGPTAVTGRIALIVDRFDSTVNFPHSSLLKGIHEGLGEETELILTQSNNDHEVEARQLRKLEKTVDGIILCPISDPRNNGLLQGLFDGGSPIVILDRFPKGLAVDTVATDNEEATGRSVRELVRRGHQRIAFFSFQKPDFSSVAERHRAYVNAVSESGITDPEPYTRWFPTQLESNHELLTRMVADALFTLVRGPQGITALFCVEDSVAAAVLQAADQLGISVPEELELATFNDWPPMMLRAPWCIHRIVQRSHDLGFEAACLLRERVQRGPSAAKVVRVPADFFVAEAGLHSPSTAAYAAPIRPTHANGGN